MDAHSGLSTPIDTANAAAIAELIRIVDAIDRAVDARQWDVARSYFAEQLHTDFEDLSDQPPADMASDDLVGGWAQNLAKGKTSFHQRTNHQVLIIGDRATMISAGYAWNRMEGNGEPLWEVWATYRHGFIRTPQGWLCNAMALKVAHQRGNLWVRDTPPV